MRFIKVILLFLFLLCLAANAQVANPKLVWKKAGELPVPEGFVKSIGISGAYSAFLGEYLIVAGGANFPKGHPFFEQGKKEYYSDIFVFNTANDQFSLVSRGHLPIKAGHGATVVVDDDSLYLIGGKNNEQAFDSIIKITLNREKKPLSQLIGQLPFTWNSGGAALKNQALYLFAGKINGQLSNLVCKYSFTSGQCIDADKTPSLPGMARADFPSINHLDKFYVFGGLNLAAGKDEYVLSDSYIFDFKTFTWKELATITHQGELFSVAGGGVASLSNEKLVLLGGVNRQVFNDAIWQLSTLDGDNLTDFKQQYFNLSVDQINFSRQQLIYDIKTNIWQVMPDKVPFFGGAGPLTVTQKGGKVYWVSGEVKPVIRTPNVYQGNVR